VKHALTKNYEEAISVKKDLRSIRVISDNEPTKESKDMGKRSQASMSRDKKKEPSGFESLTHLVKALTTKME